MAAPPGRILAVAVSSSLGGIHHGLDAAPHPAGSFELGLPDWLQNLHHMCRRHVGNSRPTDHRVDIGFQRVGPLLAMLGIAPAILVRGNVGLRYRLERDACNLGGLFRSQRFGGSSLTLGNGVNASTQLHPKRASR